MPDFTMPKPLRAQKVFLVIFASAIFTMITIYFSLEPKRNTHDNTNPFSFKRPVRFNYIVTTESTDAASSTEGANHRMQNVGGKEAVRKLDKKGDHKRTGMKKTVGKEYKVDDKVSTVHFIDNDEDGLYGEDVVGDKAIFRYLFKKGDQIQIDKKKTVDEKDKDGDNLDNFTAHFIDNDALYEEEVRLQSVDEKEIVNDKEVDQIREVKEKTVDKYDDKLANSTAHFIDNDALYEEEVRMQSVDEKEIVNDKKGDQIRIDKKKTVFEIDKNDDKLANSTVHFIDNDALYEEEVRVQSVDEKEIVHDKEGGQIREVKEKTVDMDGVVNIINKYPVRGENNIFFVETRCAVWNSTLSPPQLLLSLQSTCAIESAARANPTSNVYLYHTCPLDVDSLTRSSRHVQDLVQLPNVHVWHQSVASLFQDTPLEELYRSGRMAESKYPLEHASDVLRYLVLWKYGGVYLDMDMIVMKSFSDLPANWACYEVEDWMGSAALAMSADGVGKKMADMCVEELRTNFTGDTWNNNGPGVITRMLGELCNYTSVETMIMNSNDPDNCQGFTALPSEVFFPIMYTWEDLFDEQNSDAVMTSLEPAHAVHLWNALMKDKSVTMYEEGSRQPMVLLRQKFCPGLYMGS